jgi:hypothetical protein
LIAILVAPGIATENTEVVLAASSESVYVATDAGVDADDSFTGQLPIGFDFSFYGQNQSNVFMTTNGILNFAGGGLAANNQHSNGALSSSGRNQSVFAFWDDLDTDGPSKLRYTTLGSTPNRKFVAQWTNMFFWGEDIQMGTFQVVLYETTNTIKIQYRDIIGAGRSQGNSATIGIKGSSGSQVTQYKSNTLNPAIESGTVLTFTPASDSDTSSYTLSTSQSYDRIFLSVAGSPTISELSLPANGATDVVTTPSLEWTASTGAATYSLLVATDSNFADLVDGFPKSLSATSYTFDSPLSESTQYFWRVIAANSVGEASSAVSQFTTQAPNADPNTISQISGGLKDGVELDPKSLGQKSLTFTLSDSDQGQKTRYRAQISADSSFSNLVIDFQSDLGDQGESTFRIGVAGGTYLTGGRNTEFNSGNYYLRIRAEDALGANSQWFEFGSPSFIIPSAPTPPPLPAPTKPLNLTATISGDRTTLKWQTPKGSASDKTIRYTGTLSGGGQTLTCETTKLDCQFLDLRKNVSYDASVIARNATGSSPKSNVVKVFIPEIEEVVQGSEIPATFEPSASRIGISSLGSASQAQLVSAGIVDAPSTTVTIGVTNNLTNIKFDVETLLENAKTIAPGTAIAINLTPPADTPNGTRSYAYVRSPGEGWISLGDAPAVAGTSSSLPPMSFVFPGSYEILWTLKAPATSQSFKFASLQRSQFSKSQSADPDLGSHTIRLGVAVEQGFAELPILVSATPTPTPTPTLTPTPEPTVSPEPVATTTEPEVAPESEEIVAFSPLDDPAGVADTAVTALALAAAAGAAGAAGAKSSGGSSSGGGSKGEESGSDEGSLSTIDIELSGHASEKLGTGDKFAIWSIALLNFFDKPSHNAGVKSAKFSPLISKFIIDGAYLRAMLGSIALVGTFFAMGLGTVSAIKLGGAILPPPALVLGIIAVIGVFDALSGFLGMFAFAVTALALADERSASDIRMLMGVVLLGFGPVLLANGARNFRGESLYSGEYIWERITDVAVGTFLAGWSAMAMVSVLPALAGLTLPIADSAKSIGLAVAIATVFRIVLEEVSARLFPERLNKLHPTDVDDSSLAQKMIALALRAGVFFFVAAAFIGVEWYLVVGTLLFIIPSYLGLFADRMPNNPNLYQLIPAGIPGLIFSLALGAATVALISMFFGDDPLLAKLAFVLVPIPVFIVAVLSLIGREPREGDVRWYERESMKLLYRVGGAVAFITVLKMTGILA